MAGNWGGDAVRMSNEGTCYEIGTVPETAPH